MTTKSKSLAAFSNAVLHAVLEQKTTRIAMSEPVKTAMHDAVANGATPEEIKEAHGRAVATASVFAKAKATRKAPAVPKAPKRAKAKTVKRRR